MSKSIYIVIIVAILAVSGGIGSYLYIQSNKPQVSTQKEDLQILGEEMPIYDETEVEYEINEMETLETEEIVIDEIK